MASRLILLFHQGNEIKVEAEAAGLPRMLCPSAGRVSPGHGSPGPVRPLTLLPARPPGAWACQQMALTLRTSGGRSRHPLLQDSQLGESQQHLRALAGGGRSLGESPPVGCASLPPSDWPANAIGMQSLDPSKSP